MCSDGDTWGTLTVEQARDVCAKAWKPLESLPEDRKDGRDVLLWNGRPTLGSWCDYWCDAVGRPISGVMHFVDVERRCGHLGPCGASVY